jgi:hypothetical protein
MLKSIRTAASAAEQVICDKACYVHALLPEPNAIAGTIALRNEASAVKVATPTNLVATADPPGSPGALPDDEYFFKIVAVDRNGDLSAGSTEDSATCTAGGTGSVALTWDGMANAESYRVYVGLATNTFDGYFETTEHGLLVTQVATPDVVVNPAADTGAATTGNANLKHLIAIGLPAAGKDFRGVLFDKGLTLQQSVEADRSLVIIEVKP